MNAKTKTGFDILKVALSLGILGDLLLRQTPWGLNVLLFNLAFVGGLVLLLWRRKPEYMTGQTIALLAAQIFFAAMFVWRDSMELRFADSLAILSVLSVVFVPKLRVPARVAGMFHYVMGFFWSSFNAWLGTVALLTMDIEWKNGERSAWAKHAIAVFRGLLIVAPIFFVFFALFMSADTTYQGIVQRVFDIAPEEVLSHGILITLFAWLSAGYLRGIMLGNEPKSTFDDPSPETKPQAAGESKVEQVRQESGEYPVTLPDNLSILEHINKSDPPDKPSESSTTEAPKTENKKWDWAKIDNTLLPNAFTLGTVEIGVILGAINLLFLSFVLVQLPYLFGGMDLVQNTPDFKLAEYARRGFGELVVVSALVLPVLLAAHWLIPKESTSAVRLFRVLAGIQIVLLFVIMASATQRLVLLTGNLGYGLTTVRLYPMIFMIWMAIVFVWFTVTVLRGQRQYFAWGALWSAFFILAATHVLNPDEFIVRTNIRLMQQGREFDARYNANLSADATPALFDTFASLNEADQITVIRRIARHRCQNSDSGDLRSFNVSRWQASGLFDADRETMNKIGGCAANPGNNYEGSSQ